MENQKLLSTKEAAVIVGANPRTLDNWRSLGRGPVYVKLNKRSVRYALADLLAFIEKNKVEPGAA